MIESRMYQQMALTASAMAYSWSKWNGETEREQCVFQASEALEDEPLLEVSMLTHTMYIDFNLMYVHVFVHHY